MPTFSKLNRLLKRPEFLRCYSAGKRCFTSSFIVFVLSTEGAAWRVGLAVSRKVGGAVQRNRVKRLLREFFRLNQHLLPAGVELAVVPKKGIRPDDLTYNDVERELLSLVTGLFGRKLTSPVEIVAGRGSAGSA
ncbi:MAG: ribonuclease P protein component [Deltaproteobacteria bacterium]|jgi:ribonuclease P protein component|nr:ribonuclease P protein component [Deltaproteobacteria bacterium]